MRWPTLIPTALTSALSGWLVWTVLVRSLGLRVTNAGLIFEGLLGLLAAGAFFFLRRLLRRFHLERGVESYVDDPASTQAAPNEWVPALVLAGVVIMAGATAGTESLQLQSEILPLPTLPTTPRPVQPPSPPPPDPFAGVSFDHGAARRGVVFIKRTQLGVANSVGSGFIASADGLVFTSRQVAAGSPSDTRLWVGVPSQANADRLEYYAAKRVYVSPESSQVDVAVLKIAGAAPFQVLAPATTEVSPSDPVFLLGYPSLVHGEPPFSLIKSRAIATRLMWGEVPYLQTDAIIKAGHAGGPLLDAKGNVVGIVTLKKAEAQQLGYARSLTALADLRARLTGLASEVTAEPGPVRDLGAARVIEPVQRNWSVNQGVSAFDGNGLRLHRNGASFSTNTLETLPENFQLEVPCFVQYLRGDQALPETEAHALRTLSVRFGEPAAAKPIDEEGGYVFRFSQDRLSLKKGTELVGEARVGNPDRSFTLVISRRGGSITFGVDDEVLLRFEDPQPLSSGSLSMGGSLSSITFGPVTVTDFGAER